LNSKRLPVKKDAAMHNHIICFRLGNHGDYVGRKNRLVKGVTSVAWIERAPGVGVRRSSGALPPENPACRI